MEKETWKDISDFPGYQVSNHGRVKAIAKIYYRPYLGDQKKLIKVKSKELIRKIGVKFWKKRPVCAQLTLRKNNKTFILKVHRLVLIAFKGKPKKAMQGCHNDGNPLNNHINNLRWDTRKNNRLDMIRHGTCTIPPVYYGEAHHNTTLTEKDVRKIRNTVYYRGMYADLAKKYNINRLTVKRIFLRQSWINLKD